MLVGPLRGKYTAEAALTRLLAKSGLAYQRTNDRSLVVMAPSLLGAPRNGVTPSEKDQDQAAEGKPNLREQNQPPLAAFGRGGGAGRGFRSMSRCWREQLDEIIVTGSRIERSGEGPAPVQVFTKETFQRLGAAIDSRMCCAIRHNSRSHALSIIIRAVRSTRRCAASVSTRR